MANIGTKTPALFDQQRLVAAAKYAVAQQKAADLKSRSRKRVTGAVPSLAATDRADRIEVRRQRISRSDPSAFERLIGERDIVSINFFTRGLVAAKAVCRVKTLGTPGTPPGYATGFLVAAGLIVTNNHVLPDPEAASRSLAEFDHELDANFVERRGRIFPFAPAFFTSADLDFTIVAISPIGHDGTPLADFGMLPLIPVSGKGLTGEHVSIIQHPEGGTKQVVVRENRIIALDRKKFPTIREEFIHYTADTERGSSGSPIFNDQWDLVAIHHLAIVDRDRNGNALNKRGGVWAPADGEQAKAWIANEGIRISAVWAHLRAAAPFDGDAARIMATLAQEPRAANRVPPALRGGEPPNWQTLPGALDTEAFETSRFNDPEFVDSQGCEPGFLGGDLLVALPKTGHNFKGTLATNISTGGTVFDYTHFSLSMHVERRLALWTAVNIDGCELKSAKSPSWRRDDRLPASQQTLAEVYGPVPGKGRLQIDRGHLVRRLDPVWGPQKVAERAGADTFHYTNAAPQEHVYNSEVWGNLEDFVLARADERDHRATVLTGPILRPDDNFYGEGLRGGPWQIPWSFWKIAIFKRADGSPSVTGFIVEQTSTITSIFEATRYNPYTVEEARVLQWPIAVIEELTGLDFGELRTLDRMGAVEFDRCRISPPDPRSG